MRGADPRSAVPEVQPTGRPVRLSAFTTLRIGGPAELWEVDGLPELREACREPFLVLGAGSNLLVADAGVNERVVKLGRSYNDLASFAGPADLWLGAATPLPGLVRRSQRLGLSGLEGLLGVPAVLGGAVAMNAGTRFGCMADTVQEVELYVAGSVERLPAAALAFGYRRSSLPPGSVITRVRLRLAQSTPERVEALLRRVDGAREGQPKVRSAGCAFQNPPGDSAGRLIDTAGLKGLRVGDAMVAHEHANFIVNLGRATAADVLELLDRIRKCVSTPLLVEWRLWGF